MIQINKETFDLLTLVPRPDGRPGEWRRMRRESVEWDAQSYFEVVSDHDLVAISCSDTDTYYLEEL